MRRTAILVAAAGLWAPAVLAQDMAAEGDAEAGERVFRQCQACHAVINDEGETLAGRGKVGPNLYGVAGRHAGAVEDFAYSDDLMAAAEQGLEWTPETFVPYVQGPSEFLQEYLGESGARSKMVFRVRSDEDAQDVYAYLASLAPEAEEEGETGN